MDGNEKYTIIGKPNISEQDRKALERHVEKIISEKPIYDTIAVLTNMNFFRDKKYKSASVPIMIISIQKGAICCHDQWGDKQGIPLGYKWYELIED